MATPSPETREQPVGLPSAQEGLVEHASSGTDTYHTHSPKTPSTPDVDFPLLSDANRQARTPRSHTVSQSFVSSPLNPNAPAPVLVSPPAPVSAPAPPGFIRTYSSPRQSMMFNRVASEESQALASQRGSLTSNRTSMVLYRLAADDEQRTLTPPTMNRQSVLSNSGDTVFTVSYDSKYPSGLHSPSKFIPYPFDPSTHIDTPEDDDALHDPSDNTPLEMSSGIPLRGLLNVGVLVLVIAALLCLFIFYPIWHYVVRGNGLTP